LEVVLPAMAGLEDFANLLILIFFVLAAVLVDLNEKRIAGIRIFLVEFLVAF
jgi:hypothetical protein